MSEVVKLHAADGHELDAYVAMPEGTPKAALVIIQEIFGVNHHMRSVVDRFARQGYLAVAPALFDRYERGFEAGYEGEGWQRGMAIVQKMNFEWALADTLAAILYARDEYKTEVGIVGFAWAAALPGWLRRTCRWTRQSVTTAGKLQSLLRNSPRYRFCFTLGSRTITSP